MRKRICAALLAVACTVLLGGCSLFEPEEASANVYLPGDAVIVHPSSSSSSSAIEDEGQYLPSIRPSSSSSSQVSKPTTLPTSPEEVTPIDPIDNFRRKWYYGYMSDKRRRLYTRLYNCAKNNIEECDVSDLGITKDDVFETYWSFDYENPQFLELGSGYTITFLDSRISNKVKSVKINYGRTSAEVQQTEFEARAEAVLAEARTKSSDYEKLKYVHDWIVDNTVYSKTGAAYESEADGPIVYGQALCEGYSKAFMYFAQSLGFPCICSVGTANLEDHMWNMVRIGNAWYNVDVTWDDPKTQDGTQMLRHDYFLINDAQLRLDHRVEHPLILPNAPDGYFPYGYDQDAAESNQVVTIN